MIKNQIKHQKLSNPWWLPPKTKSQVVVGCKQDLERVQLPFVEIEAMVTFVASVKKIFILTPLIISLIIS